MKIVDDTLNTYLNTQKHFETNDFYSLALADGSAYYITNGDRDVTYNEHTWRHNLFLIAREQIKLQGAPSVDTLNVTIRCCSTDKLAGVPFMQACHDGTLDNATLTLYKAYFEGGVCIGVCAMFSGVTEVSSAGGITVKLAVKSTIQGLSQRVPVRIFAPQSAYTTVNGAVISSSTDSYSMLIPLKPSQNVLSRF